MNNRVSVFRKEHFNAAHRLTNPLWDDGKNAAIFGKCNNPHYHGHNYEIVVKVTGVPDPETGFVMDMKILSDIVQEHLRSLTGGGSTPHPDPAEPEGEVLDGDYRVID